MCQGLPRAGRRQTCSPVLTCLCSYTDPQVSMDLLRAVLQPSFNQDIMAVFSKYQKVSSRTKRGGGGVMWFDLCEQVCLCCSSSRRRQRT